MTYDEAMTELNRNHFYPTKHIAKTKKGKDKVDCLSVDSPEILMEDRVKKISEILGAEFSVQSITNLGYILITKK